MLDLVGDGHAQGKQSEKNVTSQLLAKKGNPTDARDMVAETEVLEPAELGLGRSESTRSSVLKEIDATISKVRLNRRKASLSPSRGLEAGVPGSTRVPPHP